MNNAPQEKEKFCHYGVSPYFSFYMKDISADLNVCVGFSKDFQIFNQQM